MDEHGFPLFGAPALSETPGVAEGSDKRILRRKLDMEKCDRCRKDKKKCQPRERSPSQPCDRCRSIGAECSPNTRKKRRTGGAGVPLLSEAAIAPVSVASGDTSYGRKDGDTAAPTWTHDQLIDTISVLRLLKMKESYFDHFAHSIEELFSGYAEFQDRFWASLDWDVNIDENELTQDLCRLTDQLLQLIGSRLDQLRQGPEDDLSPEVANLMHARRQVLLPEIEGRYQPHHDLMVDVGHLIDDLCSSKDFGAALITLQHNSRKFCSKEYIERYNTIYTNFLARVTSLPGNLGVDIPREILNCPIFFEQQDSWDSLLNAVDIGTIAACQDYTGSTILHILAGDFRARDTGQYIRNLFQIVDINRQDFVARTALHIAIGCNLESTSFLEYLLSNGADPTLRTRYGHTPLHYAASLGNSKICKLLLESGADINSQDITRGTPLVHAASHERMATIRLLLDCIKLDTAITYYEFGCPLYSPLKFGLEEAALAIMSRMDWKRNVSKVREEGTALHLAVMGGSKKLAGMIMKEMGHEVNFEGPWEGESWWFALFEAVS
ncbi:ankyrin repeat-containing domain protein, partial [Lasiosphaeria ovina]